MFAKDKVSQSLVDAVTKVVGITEAKADELPPIDKDAAAARKARQARLDAIEDAKSEKGEGEKKSSSTRTIAGKAYGGSKQKDDDEIEESADCVTKPEAKGIAKKVVKGHEKSMHKEESVQTDEALRVTDTQGGYNLTKGAGKQSASDRKDAASVVKGFRKSWRAKGLTTKHHATDASMDKSTGFSVTKEAAGNPGPVRKHVPSPMEKPSKEDMAAWHAKQKEKHSYKKEEVEELSELSKKTLGSYIKVAAQDIERSGRDQEHYGDQSDYDRGTKRQKGIAKAVDKLTKEEETLDELSKPMLATYIRRASDPTHPKSNVNLASLAADKLSKGNSKDDGEKEDKKAYQRSRSIGLAAAKMAREEVEELDEISTGLVARYSDKAAKEYNDPITTSQKKAKRRTGLMLGYNKVKGRANVPATYEDMSFADRLLQRAWLAESRGPVSGADETFTDNNIGEMSDAQTAKKEKIVMSMKKKEGEFKAKYGKNWKNVMYATATKLAMAEDYVLDEDKDDGVPFDRPYSNKPATVKDKSGAIHTPMSRVKDLARNAMKKVRTQTKIGEDTEND